MDFSESLALELYNKTNHRIFINEGNLKSKRLNRNVKIGKSFQYSIQSNTHRFIIWCIDNNFVTITEYSTDYELLGNKIEIEFEKSQILNLNIFENDQTVEFLISTSLSVMRFSLHHPSKLRQPNKDSHQYSIFYGISDLNEIKHCINHQIDVTNITTTNSVIDCTNNDAYFNYAMSNGSIFTAVVASSINIENVIYYEMRESSLLSKILPRFMQKQRSIEYTDISILDMTYVEISNVLFLVTISKDNKIRIWNLKDKNCIDSEDLLSCVLESNDSDRSLTTINHNSIISSHKIKSFFSNTNLNDYMDTVVVYFHTIIGKEILSNWIVLRIMDPNDRSRYNQHIQICCNINNAGDNMNLIDFEIGYDMKTNDIMGVWSLTSQSSGAGSNSTHSLNWVPLTEEKNGTKVTCRLYNASNELELSVIDHHDPKEAIMAKIFSPHHFSRMAVINTLNRYSDNDYDLQTDKDIDELKFRLVVAVDSKVEKQLAIYLSEDSDIDMMELNKQQWYNIFQEMVEEHFSVMEPLCLVSTSGTIGMNRYGTVSLMRRANGMEQILSGSSNTHLQEFFDESSVMSGQALLKYIHEMSTLLQSIDSWPMIEHRLFSQGESPLDICRQLSSASFDISSLSSRFDSQPHLLNQTVNLLEKLDIESIQEMASDLESCILSSLSMGMLHFSTCQVVRDRICASVALMTMLNPRSLKSTRGSDLSNLVGRITSLIKSLISVYWLLTIRQKSSPELTDIQKSQLGALNLLENRCENGDSTDILCIRVLQLFQNKFKVNNYQSHTWQSKQSEEMAIIVNYLYANSDSFPLIQICKYFFSYNMPIELMEYLTIITKSEPKGWWEGDECLANFMMGLAYLLLDKPWKAVKYIIESIRKPEISSSLLSDVILDDKVRNDIDSLVVLQAELFIKIIDVIYNTENLQAYIITMAEAAIKIIDDSMEINQKVTKYQSILMTVLFKNLLDLKKYDEARSAICQNPDVDKQKNCLRQFIMVLCDQRQLEKLVNFDYDHLNEEFINIVSSRARVSDLTDSSDPFYNVLYSFHIRRGDMKAAATCQLDLALQLDNDMKNQGQYLENSVAVLRLQNQMKAYLACITASSLLPKEDQLFVFPAKLTGDFVDCNTNVTSSNIQPTEVLNYSDHEMEICDDKPVEEGTERNIINLTQIRRQYNLIKTRLKILRESPEHGFIHSGKLTPALTLASLLEMGLFSDAIKICLDFKLDMGSVVNTIVTRCAQISKNCLDRPVLKEKENVIDSLEMLKKNVDFASFGSLGKLMWKLLSEVLQKYDCSSGGDLYLRACSKLLSNGIDQLPSWMIDSVVTKNSHSSLLRLYIANGFLEPAVNLACRLLSDRIDEVHFVQEQWEFLGTKGTEKSCQISWISYPIILHLLDILACMKKDQGQLAKELFDRLNDKFKTMVNVLQVGTPIRAIGSI